MPAVDSTSTIFFACKLTRHAESEALKDSFSVAKEDTSRSNYGVNPGTFEFICNGKKLKKKKSKFSAAHNNVKFLLLPMARWKQTVRGTRKVAAETAASLQNPMPTAQSNFTPPLTEEERKRLETGVKPSPHPSQSSDSESDTDPGPPADLKDDESVVSSRELLRRDLARINDENYGFYGDESSDEAVDDVGVGPEEEPVQPSPQEDGEEEDGEDDGEQGTGEEFRGEEQDNEETPTAAVGGNSPVAAQVTQRVDESPTGNNDNDTYAEDLSNDMYPDDFKNTPEVVLNRRFIANFRWWEQAMEDRRKQVAREALSKGSPRSPQLPVVVDDCPDSDNPASKEIAC